MNYIDKLLESYSIDGYLDKVFKLTDNEGIKDFIYYLKNKGATTLLNDFEEDNLDWLFDDIFDFLKSGVLETSETNYKGEPIYKLYNVWLFNFRHSFVAEDYDDRFFKENSCPEFLKIKIDSRAIYCKWKNQYHKFIIDKDIV